MRRFVSRLGRWLLRPLIRRLERIDRALERIDARLVALEQRLTSAEDALRARADALESAASDRGNREAFEVMHHNDERLDALVKHIDERYVDLRDRIETIRLACETDSERVLELQAEWAAATAHALRERAEAHDSGER